jgi:hypothetical protein
VIVVAGVAVALATVAAKTVVGQLVQGTPMTRDSWAEASRQIIDALASQSSRQEGGFDRISRQIDAIPVREFNEHIAAGRALLRELPGDWRDEKDRDTLIHDARIEFVHAYATAQQLADAQRQALAEVAIGGCWVWVGSLARAQDRFRGAREVLEQRILSGAEPADRGVRVDCAEVLALCKHFGERPAITAIPVVARSDREIPQAWWANIAVPAVTDQWVECVGIELRAGRMEEVGYYKGFIVSRPQRAFEIPVEVRNGRQERIVVGLTGVGPDQRSPQAWRWPPKMPGSACSVGAAGAAASFTLRRDGTSGMAITITIDTGPALTAGGELDHPRIAFLAPDLAETQP